VGWMLLWLLGTRALAVIAYCAAACVLGSPLAHRGDPCGARRVAGDYDLRLMLSVSLRILCMK